MMPIQCLNNLPALKKSGLRSQVLNTHPTHTHPHTEQHEHPRHSMCTISPSAFLFGISPVPVRIRAPPSIPAPTPLPRITSHDGVHGRRPERHRAHDKASLRKQGRYQGGPHQEKTIVLRSPQYINERTQLAQSEVCSSVNARRGDPS